MGQNDCLDIVWDGSKVRIFVVCLELHTSAPIRHGVATSAGSFTLGMEVVIVHSPKAKAYGKHKAYSMVRNDFALMQNAYWGGSPEKSVLIPT